MANPEAVDAVRDTGSHRTVRLRGQPTRDGQARRLARHPCQRALRDLPAHEPAQPGELGAGARQFQRPGSAADRPGPEWQGREWIGKGEGSRRAVRQRRVPQWVIHSPCRPCKSPWDAARSPPRPPGRPSVPPQGFRRPLRPPWRCCSSRCLPSRVGAPMQRGTATSATGTARTGRSPPPSVGGRTGAPVPDVGPPRRPVGDSRQVLRPTSRNSWPPILAGRVQYLLSSTNFDGPRRTP